MDAKISAADSADYAAKLVSGGGEGNFDIIDDVLGDLSKSVIKEGKVYIVSLGESQPPLYKIKVTKKDADTYTIQYAKSNETTVKSLDVAKNSAYNFVYASITSDKVVSVQPEKAKWDIEWTRATYKTGTLPYIFSDFVYINAKGGVQAAEVLTSTVAYDKYVASNVASTEFSNAVDIIGSKWRSGGGPNALPAVKADRFYVIKDASDNVYKVRFVSMSGGDGGERGYPVVEYALVK